MFRKKIYKPTKDDQTIKISQIMKISHKINPTLNETKHTVQVSLFLEIISPTTVIHFSISVQVSTFRRNTNQGPAFAGNHEEIFPFPHHCRIGDIPSVASQVLKNNKADGVKSVVYSQ